MNPAAGWFADPVTPNIVRYWDGAAWTEHTAPLPVHVPSAPPSPQESTVLVGQYGEPEPGGYAPAGHLPMQPYAPARTSRPYPQYVVAVPAKNDKATRALVWGIVSLLINPLVLPSILAIMFGVQGRALADQMERAGLVSPGRGRATAGIVVGIVGIGLFVFWAIVSVNRLAVG